MKALLLCLPLTLAVGCNRAGDAHAADNTSRNTRDRSGETLTPTDQSETAPDRELTQSVRQALMDDSSLSTNAKNIKVISRDGKVTLRGVVDSEEEKDVVMAKVQTVTGVHDCENQLEVKTN
jgi:hyperosmotically inducible periplasmic protein